MKEEIIKFLKLKKDAQDIININDFLNLETADELNKLSEILDKLEREHLIFKTKKNKYMLYENCTNLRVGKLSINKRGNGFLILDGEDLYINFNNLNGATNGDIVLAETFFYRNDFEGKIIKILERNTKNLIGTIYYKKNMPYLKLDDEKKALMIELDLESTKNCVEGTKVLVNTVKTLGNNKYYGKVVKIIGHLNDPGVDIKTVAYKHDIFDEFSSETLEQIENIPGEVSEIDLIGRKDLTNEVIFTIDGSDTKDIDDALSFNYQDNIYTLGVHIADVSYYVKKDSPLDKDAHARGTSSYLADSV
ncbi:MAG: RNB domain-containing ribonuclease, partial [Bacilli bacterium]|nr:RNB domain-containing ribonuclease [Bacilli bacterium]